MSAREKIEFQKKIQQRLLGIIAEKLHTKFESAAMAEGWVEVDLKLPLIAAKQSKNT